MFTQRLVSWLRRLRRPARLNKAALALETLEDRLTPSASANDVFVGSLYQGLLGRNADPNGLAYWSGQLNAGHSRTEVAQGIAGSDEALGRDVKLFYDVLLQRPADDAGLDYWTSQLKSGATLDQVKAGLLGSDEFFSSVGGTNASFVGFLYVHELGRAADANGLTYWEGQLKAGESRTAVADAVLSTPEASREKTTSFFADVLDRLPDAGGLSYWSRQLQAGVSETKVLSGILGSNEYFGLVQVEAAKLPSDANQGATELIDSVGLFTGPLPNAEYLAHKIVDAPKPPVMVVDPCPPVPVADPNPGVVCPTPVLPPPDAIDTTVDTTIDTSTPCDTPVDNSCDNSAVVDDSCDDNSAIYDTSVDNSCDNSAPVDNSCDDGSSSYDYSYVDTSYVDNSCDTGSTDYSDASYDSSFDSSCF